MKIQGYPLRPLYPHLGVTSLRYIVKGNPYEIPNREGSVEFRLTYSGRLLASANKNPHAAHKMALRRAFHPQLRRLWSVTRELAAMMDPLPAGPITINMDPRKIKPRREALAARFKCGDFEMVPLVTEDLALICGIDVLMLRPDAPGSLIKSGDIDGRLKTLFDALRMPGPDVSELAGASPTADEMPLYCLLQDDKLISKVTVQTDLLLEQIPEQSSDEGEQKTTTGWQRNPIHPNDGRLVVTVTLRPSDSRYGTQGFYQLHAMTRTGFLASSLIKL